MEVFLLPFLKHKPVASLIISQRKPDAPSGQTEHSIDNENHAMEACAEDLIRAVHSKDSKAVAEALQSAFECMEREPHEEGPHTNDPHSYAAQNIKAAE